MPRSVLPIPIVAMFLLCLLWAPQSQARYCFLLFSKPPIDLKAELSVIKRLGTAAYRKQSEGDWVKVKGQWIRYKIMGMSGPLRVHFFGLGSELVRSYGDNLTLKKHAESGRVLMIELPGQGLTEVQTAYRLTAQGQPSRRIIDYKENTELSYLATKMILEKIGEPVESVEVWSGNSFGGLNLTGVQASHLKSDTLLQFFATAITSLENKFVSQRSNDTIEQWRLFVDKAFNLGTTIGLSLVRGFIGLQKIVDKSDSVKLDGATGQYFGSKRVDGTKLVENFPSGSKVQIFTAEKDIVVYPMMHIEFISALLAKDQKVTAVLVKEAGHNLTKTATPDQVQTIQELTKNPKNYNGFYELDTAGNLTPMTNKEALDRYKALSKRIWSIQSHNLKRTFRLLGHQVTYPASWR